VAFSLQAKYTDWATVTGRQILLYIIILYFELQMSFEPAAVLLKQIMYIYMYKK
jgi:hypothetical protein